MNKTSTLIASLSLAMLAGCASAPYQPTLATPCFQASTITNFELESPRNDVLVVEDGAQAWRLHLRGSCPELSGAGRLVFSDEMSLKAWPDQPWREGYGLVRGWPENGTYANRSSSLMRVCSNRMSWIHAFHDTGAPKTPGNFASWGCRVDRVEPLWR